MRERNLSIDMFRGITMLLMVFVSVPLLFLSGVSWPQSSIPGAWQGVSWLFPSTFGIRAFIRVNSMGASFSQILPEIRILWIQAAAYLGMACVVYGYQKRIARLHHVTRFWLRDVSRINMCHCSLWF